MNEHAYEYYGLMAATWDLLRGDTSDWADRAFYRDVIRQHGEPVLDIGCGTGRLLLDFLADGVDIDGIDNSPEMLAICREKARERGLTPVLYEQRMEAMTLPRRYRTILVPSSSFQLVLDVESAHEAMRRFYDHLEPGGVLVMPFMTLWREGDPLETSWQLVGENRRPGDGMIVRKWSRTWYTPENGFEHSEDCYELVDDGAVIETENHVQSPATRSYTQSEARQLYEEAGFVDIRLCHVFTFEPATPDDTLFTVFGSRPDQPSE